MPSSVMNLPRVVIFPSWYLATARLCSSSVRENSWVPSPLPDEVEESRSRGLHHGAQRRRAGHRDRRGRQAVARVCVPWRIGGEVALADVAVEALAHAVDHRGIGLQAHADAQPVHEHRGDRGRSLACPVSFSTIEARISASYGVLSGRSGSRAGQRLGEALLHRGVARA
jgi:hypothetical protein